MTMTYKTQDSALSRALYRHLCNDMTSAAERKYTPAAELQQSDRARLCTSADPSSTARRDIFRLI